LREIVFGLNDRLVTTLVLLMAVSEVATTRLLPVVLGEVLAGGISMALGGYLSARTAKQMHKSGSRSNAPINRSREKKHVEGKMRCEYAREHIYPSTMQLLSVRTTRYTPVNLGAPCRELRDQEVEVSLRRQK
jgi:hypothetical protein